MPLILGIGVAGGAGYLAWDYLKRKKAQNAQALLPSNAGDTVINITNTLPTTTSTSKTATDNFPLKQGSRGTRVAQLQQALARIIGTDAMNANGGIDGIFGPGTANALKMAGYGEVIDQATFTKIINRQGTGLQVAFNPQALASSLYSAARASDSTGTLAILAQIGSTDQYSQVNGYYKEIPIIGKTIVTDLLDYAFKSNEQAKQQIRNEFLRMGLKMNASGTWSLQGLGLYRDIITLRDTFVRDPYNNHIPVNKNTILGDEVKVANGLTWFRAVDNSILQVPTQDVKYA